MQPFTISCLTCGTKLKVSDESLIGEILMCAKCHSMVLVEPPANAPPVAPAVKTPTADSPTTDPSTATPLDQPEQPPQPQRSEDGAAAAASAAAAAIPAHNDSPSAPVAPAASAPAATAPQTATSADHRVATTAAAAVSLAMPTAPKMPWQRCLIYGASGTVGVVFVVSAWLFWRARQAETPTAPVPSPLISVVQPTQPSNPSAQEQTQVTRAVERNELVAAPPSPAPQPPDPLKPADQRTDSAVAEENNPDAAEPPDVDPISPKTPNDPLLVAEADPARELSDENQPRPMPTPPDELPFGPAPPIEYPIPDPHPDVAARLAMRVAAIELSGDPADGEVLTRVTTMLSQMTAVPIRLDAVALKQIGKSGDSPVRLKMENATVAELLGAMLGAWGLSAVPTGDHVLVTVPQAGAETNTFERRYPFDDLAASRPQLREIADLIRRAVAPVTWSTRGGHGAISISGTNMQITQSPVAHHQVLMLCEKLRVARGLRPKSIYFRSDPASLPLDSRSLLAAPSLTDRGDFSTSQQVPLAVYAQSVQHRAGIEVAIDELALYRAGFSPEILVGYDGPEKPLAEVLAEVLAPVNLAYRIIDAKTIQITTSKELARTAEIEFFQLAKLPAGGVEALLTRIKADVAPAYWTAAGDNTYLHFDALSKCLIVRAAQPVQQEIQSSLIDWGFAAQVAN